MPTHKEAIQMVLDALTNDKTGAIGSLKEVNMRTADAIAAFNDSTFPSIGIRIRHSAASAIASVRPFPSFPIRNAVPFV